MLARMLSVVLALIVCVSVMNYFTLWQARKIHETWPLIRYFLATGIVVGYLCYPAICFIFRYAYRLTDKIWIPQLSLQLGSIMGVAFIAYWLFSELPAKGTLWGGLLVVAGIVLAVFWK